jgi:hypothetical protein
MNILDTNRNCCRYIDCAHVAYVVSHMYVMINIEISTLASIRMENQVRLSNDIREHVVYSYDNY